MELSGEEKKLQALFSELKKADEETAPRFGRGHEDLRGILRLAPTVLLRRIAGAHADDRGIGPLATELLLGLIDHVFDLLTRHGIGETVLTTSYMAEAFGETVEGARLELA